MARAKSSKSKSRIYWREQGGERRAYADFRDMGGGREALKAPGETRATTDHVIAEKLVADRLRTLQEAKRVGVLTGVTRQATLGPFVTHHLVQKAKSGKFSESWLTDSERMLRAAVEFFGAARDLATIGVEDVQAWVNHLATLPSKRRVIEADGTVRTGTLGGGAIRHHLNVLSNVYKRAQSERCVPPGYNPCSALMDKPAGKREEARWLEVHEAALLLEAARTYKAKRADAALPFIFPLLATYLLTGGRETEVLGLEVEDVSFDRRTITFRPNRWRRLKTRTSHRTVPMWPQLETVLREYLSSANAPAAGGLLFPSPRLGGAGMVTDFRKALDAVAERAGWKAGAVRSKMFRHTYCSARLQTLDQGAPVSPYTVGRELGHGGVALVNRVYAHLGEVRHRSEMVEYRVKQHEVKLGEPLRLLRSA
jgi:integrase